MSGSVAIFELCEDKLFEATALGSANWNEYVLTDASFETVGPATQDLVVHAEGSNLTTNYRWRIVLQRKFKNGPWLDDASPVVLLADTGGAGWADGTYRISNAFADRSKLGMRIRIVLQVQIAAGQSGTQRGNMTIAVATRFFSS